MSSLISLPEDLFEYVNSYLIFKQRVSLLSCSKYLRKHYFNKIVKLRLNYFDSMSFILNYRYHNFILKKVYKRNNICLNLSYLNNIKKISLIKKCFHKISNLNTLNIRLVYNKYFFIDDLLKLFNIKTLILTCNSTDKKVLFNNLNYLHNHRNINTIIIEEFIENNIYQYHHKEILISEKNCIKQFIGQLYNDYEKEKNFQYNSIDNYLNSCDNNLRLLHNYHNDYIFTESDYDNDYSYTESECDHYDSYYYSDSEDEFDRSHRIKIESRLDSLERNMLRQNI